MIEWNRTYDVLSLDGLDELGVLSVVDMGTERDVVDGDLSGYRVALETLELFGFRHDVLKSQKERNS
jgi:hypothetical protein